MQALRSSWPTDELGRGVYQNAETGRRYRPHHEAEADAVYTDDPRITLIRGGEGSGKTTAGAIKALERVRRGCNGVVTGPNFEHFKISTWPELQRWIPWDQVIDKHRYREDPDWEPVKRFRLGFKNEAYILLGGIKKDGSWEGPNVNWWWFDEARHLPSDKPLKTANGRVRIPGPHGEIPQIWLTTTPEVNWLYEALGPIQVNDDGEVDDPYLDIKRQRRDVVMLTLDNEHNLEEDFVKQRSLALSEVEVAVLTRGEWGSLDAANPFLPSMTLWEACRARELEFSDREPMILAVDAAKNRDSFAIVGVSRHPNRERWDRTRDVAVRYVKIWKGKEVAGGYDFPGGPVETLRNLVRLHPVLKIVYDPYMLHDTMNRLRHQLLVEVEEFPQGKQRLIADQMLLETIMRRGIEHDGNKDLYEHMNHADRKTDTEERRLRIVKRRPTMHIDAVVALSMANYAVHEYPFGAPVQWA